MKDILQQINSVDGVIGSALFTHSGELLDHAFPALIETASLQRAAALTQECSYGLQMSQTLELLDLRYADGRVLVKRISGASLFLLCANNINLQVLSITLNLAAQKLDAKLAELESSSAVQENAVQDDALLRMSISHLANKQASASFDSLGMIAVSQPTCQFISDFHKSTFKKLKLTNRTAGTSGTFPVMVMKDMGQQYDGTIVVGPGIEKKLRVSEGDKVEIDIG
ncbi:MAG: roadblock/LC7 domain-containing protein [Desulfuromonadaceae bacterium]|nr:roadblock/LC7 domain-containing protein [Desulfuromonadaceae bacterium]MDD2854007.1 roadblock/LC7 domain-containing protein [Desulfuromonadaceae bacterium]